MEFPERFSALPDYAFPRLRALLDRHKPGSSPVDMTIGEPRHAFPDWVRDEITKHAGLFNRYPKNEGYPELREAIAHWMGRRYSLSLDPETQIMALNGTREGLYNAAMALCPETKNGKRPVVLCPNPFYQVYLVAALSIGAEPVFVPATAATGHLPDYTGLPAQTLNRVAVAYICSPANPQGTVADRAYWRTLISLAEKYNFRIFADECYAEIHRGNPPPGALQVANELDADPDRVLVFHSLSKRSNLPGLRSGFVAARSSATIDALRQLREYAGAPLPGPLQMAAARVWSDETHVEENRRLYAAKYKLADRLFGNLPNFAAPQAGFFLWLPVSNGETATLSLWRETGVRVLPGAYLGQGEGEANPGHNYIRVAMVSTQSECIRGLTALRDRLYG